MAKKTIIDEDLVRQAIGNTPSILDADPPPFDERIIKTVEVPAETPQSGERRKRMAVPDFEQTFMSLVDIRFRAAIYVSAETKHKISEVVKKIGKDGMTATSYVENILRHHLETYKDEINRIHKYQNFKNLL